MAEGHFYPGVIADDCNWAPGDPAWFGAAEETLGLTDVGVGLAIRFPGVTIPPGATITAAHVTLIAVNALTGDDSADCYFEDADNAVAPTNYAEAAALAKTTGVSWVIPNTSANTAYDTPSLTSILQDVIDRPGWVQGNALQVIVEMDLVGSTRDFYAKDFNAGQYEAELHVTWIDPPTPANGNNILPTMTGAGTLAVRSGTLARILPALEITGTITGGSVATLDSLLPRPLLTAYAGAHFTQILPALFLQSSGLIGATGRLEMPMPRLALSSHGFAGQLGSADIVLPALSIFTRAFNENLYSLDAFLPRLTVVSRGVTGNVGKSTIVLPLFDILGHGLGDNPGHADLVLPGLYIVAHGEITQVSPTYLVLAMNLKNFAISEYQNWQFNAFASYKDRYLASDASGIHVISGDDDGGAPIVGNIKFGNYPVGGAKPRDIYVSGRSSGQIRVAVNEDEGEDKEGFADYLYPELGQDRVRVPRGLLPTYFQVSISNPQGSRFDLDSVAVMAESVRRKKK